MSGRIRTNDQIWSGGSGPTATSPRNREVKSRAVCVLAQEPAQQVIHPDPTRSTSPSQLQGEEGNQRYPFQRSIGPPPHKHKCPNTPRRTFGHSLRNGHRNVRALLRKSHTVTRYPSRPQTDRSALGGAQRRMESWSCAQNSVHKGNREPGSSRASPMTPWCVSPETKLTTTQGSYTSFLPRIVQDQANGGKTPSLPDSVQEDVSERARLVVERRHTSQAEAPASPIDYEQQCLHNRHREILKTIQLGLMAAMSRLNSEDSAQHEEALVICEEAVSMCENWQADLSGSSNQEVASWRPLLWQCPGAAELEHPDPQEDTFSLSKVSIVQKKMLYVVVCTTIQVHVRLGNVEAAIHAATRALRLIKELTLEEEDPMPSVGDKPPHPNSLKSRRGMIQIFDTNTGARLVDRPVDVERARLWVRLSVLYATPTGNPLQSLKHAEKALQRLQRYLNLARLPLHTAEHRHDPHSSERNPGRSMEHIAEASSLLSMAWYNKAVALLRIGQPLSEVRRVALELEAFVQSMDHFPGRTSVCQRLEQLFQKVGGSKSSRARPPGTVSREGAPRSPGQEKPTAPGGKLRSGNSCRSKEQDKVGGSIKIDERNGLVEHLSMEVQPVQVPFDDNISSPSSNPPFRSNFALQRESIMGQADTLGHHTPRIEETGAIAREATSIEVQHGEKNHSVKYQSEMDETKKKEPPAMMTDPDRGSGQDGAEKSASPKCVSNRAEAAARVRALRCADLSQIRNHFECRSWNAVLIQRAWRAYKARAEFARRVQLYLHVVHDLQSASATRIQIAYLLYRHKHRLQLQLEHKRSERAADALHENACDSSVGHIARRWRHWVRRGGHTAAAQSAKVMQTLMAQRRQDALRLEAESHAKSVLTRWWVRILRPMQQRRRAAQRRVEAERRAIEIVQSRAVLRIQCVGQGYARRCYLGHLHGRKQCEQRFARRAKDRAIHVIRFCLVDYFIANRQLQRYRATMEPIHNAAATQIQRAWRHTRWNPGQRRRQTLQLCSLQRAAIGMLQRELLALRALRETRVCRIRQYVRTRYGVEEHCKRLKAVLCLQRFVRRYIIARRRVRRLRVERGFRIVHAARYLQCVGRGYIERTVSMLHARTLWRLAVQYEADQSTRRFMAACRIQQGWKGYHVRHVVLPAKRLLRAAERREMQRLVEQSRREDAWADVVQAYARAWLGRRRWIDWLTRIHLFVVRIQTHWRMYSARKQFQSTLVQQFRVQKDRALFEREVEQELLVHYLSEVERYERQHRVTLEGWEAKQFSLIGTHQYKEE